MKTNANWSTISTGFDASRSGDRENTDQRQVARNVRGKGHRSGDRENVGQRQEMSFAVLVDMSSGDRENVVRRYTFKLYPTATQERELVKQAALLATFWNAALEERETQWAHECQRKSRKERKGLSFFDQGKSIKLIRKDDPDFAAMSSLSMARCLNALDEAFKAFFKRAKGGAGKSSGYPQYKSPYAIANKGSDCTVWHGARAIAQAPLSGCGWRLDCAGKHYKLYAKGVTGLIRARGRFPVAPLDYRTMEIMRRGGVWQMSIVAVMETRREKDAAAPKATVEFDLIDEFASVKGANGECLPGWEAGFSPADEQISPAIQSVNEAPAAEASEMGSDGRAIAQAHPHAEAAEASESGSEGRPNEEARSLSLAAEASEIQAQGDIRFKRGSYRWRQERRRVAKIKAREARRCKEALHLWTTRLIGGVSELTAVCPPIRENTKSAKGNARNRGAAVKAVAMVNRHILAQAPAMALQMLEYKAKEAGIQFARVSPDEHNLAIGQALVVATKAVRSTKRAIKKQKEVTHV